MNLFFRLFQFFQKSGERFVVGLSRRIWRDAPLPAKRFFPVVFSNADRKRRFQQPCADR